MLLSCPSALLYSSPDAMFSPLINRTKLEWFRTVDFSPVVLHTGDVYQATVNPPGTSTFLPRVVQVATDNRQTHDGSAKERSYFSLHGHFLRLRGHMSERAWKNQRSVTVERAEQRDD
jgi:hypothetical protein